MAESDSSPWFKKPYMLVLPPLILVTVLLFSPLTLQKLRVNFFYYLSLLVTFSVPAFLTWELFWQQKSISFWYWLLAYNVTGVYYSLFGEPNILNVVWDLTFAMSDGRVYYLTFGKTLALISGVLAWFGFCLLFYHLAPLLHKGYERAHMGRFIFSFLLYLFYLNLAIFIIRPYFGL